MDIPKQYLHAKKKQTTEFIKVKFSLKNVFSLFVSVIKMGGSEEGKSSKEPPRRKWQGIKSASPSQPCSSKNTEFHFHLQWKNIE